jgi:PadR family transcriptional regulator PadR
MNLENTSVQMRKGILEFCVMHVIARGEVYTSDLIQELTAAKMVVVEGTLYPLLTRLKNAGLLQYAWKESTSGPPRKYYSLTDKGAENMAGLTSTWHEILTSVTTLMGPAALVPQPSADEAKTSDVENVTQTNLNPDEQPLTFQEALTDAPAASDAGLLPDPENPEPQPSDNPVA